MRDVISAFAITIGSMILLTAMLALLTTTDIIPLCIAVIKNLPFPYWFMIGASMVFCGLVGRD